MPLTSCPYVAPGIRVLSFFTFLQLLGDAILGFLVTTFIFLECEEGLEPKTLFERKRAFVNNQSLVNFSTVELMIVTLR